MCSRSIFLCAAAFILTSVAAGEAAIERTPDPVIVRADKLEALIGKPPRDLRAFALRHGSWVPIPFQVDERMEVPAYKSWTTRVEILTYAFDYGPKAEPDPDSMLDNNDEVVFMAFSAGGRASGGQGPPGSETCEEIEITARDGSKGYVYVCSMFAPGPLSETRFVALHGEDRLEGLSYDLGYIEGNPVNFDRLQTKLDGKLRPDVVDRFKLKVDVEIGLGIAGYPLTDDDYVHFVRGVKEGPVRVIKEFETVLETWGGAQFRSYNHVYFYPYHIEYDMKARGAANWGKTFNMSHLIMAIDLNDLGRGMEFFSEHNPRRAYIDGQTNAYEMNMDYGPTEWSAVTGHAGTIIVHMGLDRFTPLYKDLYYADNEVRGDPPEDEPGMIGKFGYIIRNLQKAGFDPFPVRFAVMPLGQEYEEGLESRLTDMYSKPLEVKVKRHTLFSLAPDAPAVADTREDKPGSIFAQQERSLLRNRFILPSFIFDPELLGSGPGLSYVDIDFLGTGTYFDAGALFTERGYASYWINVSELRWIKGVESFRISLGLASFPAEPYYGIGNDTDKDDKTLYWWREQKARVQFKKYFGGVYGAEFEIGYRQVEIDKGIQPVTGEGVPSFEEHYGFDDELTGERFGDPVYGREAGNHNGIQIELYRDMRHAKNLPKFGNYQEIEAYIVSSAFGADYDYANVKVELRGYWHPDFLNPIPWLDREVNPRRTFLNKWIGPDKNRAFAVRIAARRLFAQEIEFEGREVLDVPFYDLNRIGGSSTLKGYSSKRFRDNDAVYASLEYRWTWWKFEDIALFYDVGMVMDDLLVRQNWDLDRLHTGYGFSYRIHVPPHVIVTFEWGWSVEEQAILHQANVGF